MVQIHSGNMLQTTVTSQTLKAVLKDYNWKSTCYYSAADCSIVKEFDVSVHYESAELLNL